MTRQAPPRLAIAILERFLPGNDPLIGDLIEAGRARSRAWFWAQVVAALIVHAFNAAAFPKRLTIESALVGTAMLGVLAFHAVVAARLLEEVLLVRAWMPRTSEASAPHWGAVAAFGFLAAIAIGRGIAVIHGSHRIRSALAVSTAATTAAFLNLCLFVPPDALTSRFVPADAGTHIAASMLFISGLFLGMTRWPARMGRRSTTAALCIVAAGLLPPAAAQVPADARFEVASIRRNTDTSLQGTGLSAPQPGGRYVAMGVTLQRLISDAYGGIETAGGPPWASRDRFNVIARGAAGGTPPDIQNMLRTLLAERFGLRVHTEARETDVFLLQPARPDRRTGPGLRATDDACAAAAARYVPSAAPSTAPPCGDFRMSANALVARGMTLASLAGRLSGRVGRPVIDDANMPGAFDIELRWTSDSGLASIPRDSAGIGELTPDGVTLFTALQEQLGLRLVPSRAPVDVMVIDNAAPPTPD